MICSYQSARDLFGAARDASLELERTLSQLETMRARRSRIGGGGITGMPHGQRSDVNGTSQSIALMDREALLRSRIEEDERLLDTACQVAYGKGKAGGGVSALLGSAYADVLYFRYVLGEPWGTVARECMLSERTAREYANTAMDAVDAYGVDATMNGLGLAEG